MKTKLTLVLISLCFTLSLSGLHAQNAVSDSIPDKLVVVWTSGDAELAESMVLMYAHAAKKNKWFQEVTLIIWGPSQKLLTENEKIREKVKQMQKDGVILEACIACANMLGTTEKLKELGIDVKGMGKPLTGYLKSSAKVLTF